MAVPLRQLGGYVTPVTTPAATPLRPGILPVTEPVMVALTPVQQLTQLFPKATPQQVQSLAQQAARFDQPAYLYEVIGLTQKLGVETTLTYLQSETATRATRWEDVIFGAPTLQKAREKSEIDADILRNKTVATKGPKCRRCGSTNTIAAEKQIRSADEPMTTIVSCLNCGMRTRYN